MAKKYTKSHSNYILRSNPSATKSGYVYENDLPTTSQQYNSVNGNTLTSTDGGFSFVVNTSPDDKKSYNNDGWGQKTYTLADLNVTSDDFKSGYGNEISSNIKKQKYVNLNKTYVYLSDYCYFGSSNAMLKAATDDIINNFPAGIYAKSITTGTTIMVSDYDNKLMIDLFNYYSGDIVNLTYDLKTMVTSYLDYEVVLPNVTGDTYIGDVVGFTGYTSISTGLTFKISGGTNNFDGGVLIRPKKIKRDTFFNNLDDFQQTLLNQHSVPKYKSTFKIPKDGLNGMDYEYKTFIWLTSDDGYNIDIESSNYITYMSDLIDATNNIDEIYSDNLYRSLTHDSIKNLDSTYSREIDDEMLSDIIIGGTQIQRILRLYGRSFDELKKYIEGISFVNAITYDGKDNLPSEYLPGKLNNSGWDVFSLLNEINQSGETMTGLYPGTTQSYDVNYVNNEILRRLILNSKHIFKSKGTRKSIRKLLGLLGFEESWYEMREYTQTVNSLISGSTVEEIARLNYNIYPESYTLSDGKGLYEYSFNQTLFDNTNVGVFAKCPICGSENFIISASNGGVNLITDSLIDTESTPYTYGFETRTVNLIEGQEYTLSVNGNSLNASAGCYLVSFIYYTDWGWGSSIQNTSTDDTTVSLTFTAPSGTTYHISHYYYPDAAYPRPGSVKVNWVKLETGSTATPWSPSPEDEFPDDKYAMCIENRHVFDLTGNTYGYPKPWSSSDYYFQQKGNWYRETGGIHTDLTGKTYVNEITYGNNPHIGNGEYDNGYDYINQFGDIFKRYVRGTTEQSVSGFTNKGFELSTSKNVDNIKICYNDSTSSSIDNRLLLNIKNTVIGIDGNKVMQSFFNNNSSIQTFTNYGGNGELVVNDNSEQLIQIINLSGSTSVSVNLLNNGNIKVHNSILGNGEDVTIGGEVIKAGYTCLIKNMLDIGIVIEQYNGIDEFNILKNISLPYLEQLIPSTSIFDFVLIDRDTPKWLLVDEYCQRDINGLLTGYKVIAYQNINYFDYATREYDLTLTQKIERDFGTGFTYFDSVTSQSIMENESGYNLIFENGTFELVEMGFGVDNIYFFKRESEDCGFDNSPIWAVDPGLI